MLAPIETVHLFPELDKELIVLLRSLKTSDWDKPTRAKRWTVKDIASHLLDGNLRTLSMSRDNYFGDTPPIIDSYESLVQWLNKLNADWVTATRRLSPDVLINLLASTGKAYSLHLQTLEPFEPAIFSVDWAGEKQSLNWFHIAREYTEKWHHQQQIRESVGKQGILGRKFYFPVLQTFLRGLPHAYRNLHVETPVMINVTITGEAGGKWALTNRNGKWEDANSGSESHAEITIAAEDAWKLFTKGLTENEARTAVSVSGRDDLAGPFMSLVAVMA